MDEARKKMILTYMDILKRVSGRFEFSNALAKDLTVKDVRIIEYIHDQVDVSMQQISEYFSIPPSSATRYIDKLVQKDYIERETSQIDRRKVILKVSEKGMRMLNKRLRLRLETLEKLFGNLSNGEIGTLQNLLQKLIVD